ncbi:alpha/beta hydrolase [Legionella yabuuchiae]|uniref:alpha/beta hydrolase n=1 Tax=Legionella yabuuchiae TaxID=376727 RepID=UPI0010566273|nr:alpha/beta fold hydrolase [Legionella yabuuchiae]
MNIDDFRYMWRGKAIRALSKEQLEWLSPIDWHEEHHERALLLLHGFSSSPAVYRELIPTLSRLYDAVVCPALPGHATHIAAFAKVQAHEWVSAAEDSCENLTKHYKQVDVMGLSLGGLLACHLANSFSLHHLYLLAPALSLRLNLPLAIALAKLLRSLGFKHLRNRAGNLRTNRAAEIAYRHLPIATIIEILTLIKEFKFSPPTCPVDVFLGAYDEVVDSHKIEDYFNKLPNVDIHWLQNSAHILPLDGDIDRIIACLKQNWEQEKKT